jgi:hypothetical protein
MRNFVNPNNADIVQKFVSLKFYNPMTYWQGTVFSLILAPIRSELRGFCLTPLISPLGKGGRRGVDWTIGL